MMAVESEDDAMPSLMQAPVAERAAWSGERRREAAATALLAAAVSAVLMSTLMTAGSGIEKHGHGAPAMARTLAHGL